MPDSPIDIPTNCPFRAYEEDMKRCELEEKAPDPERVEQERVFKMLEKEHRIHDKIQHKKRKEAETAARAERAYLVKQLKRYPHGKDHDWLRSKLGDLTEKELQRLVE